ncbi:hypothetical protein LXL04_019392 [Taraxacum kok-saghyz]
MSAPRRWRADIGLSQLIADLFLLHTATTCDAAFPSPPATAICRFPSPPATATCSSSATAYSLACPTYDAVFSLSQLRFQQLLLPISDFNSSYFRFQFESALQPSKSDSSSKDQKIMDHVEESDYDENDDDYIEDGIIDSDVKSRGRFVVKRSKFLTESVSSVTKKSILMSRGCRFGVKAMAMFHKQTLKNKQSSSCRLQTFGPPLLLQRSKCIPLRDGEHYNNDEVGEAWMRMDDIEARGEVALEEERGAGGGGWLMMVVVAPLYFNSLFRR